MNSTGFSGGNYYLLFNGLYHDKCTFVIHLITLIPVSFALSNAFVQSVERALYRFFIIRVNEFLKKIKSLKCAVM